jgi:hypothetical protein
MSSGRAYKGKERIRTANHQDNPDRVLPKNAGAHMRSRTTTKRLLMYRGKAVRDKSGKIIGGAFMSPDAPSSARIAPNRAWFGTYAYNAIISRFFRVSHFCVQATRARSIRRSWRRSGKSSLRKHRTPTLCFYEQTRFRMRCSRTTRKRQR